MQNEYDAMGRQLGSIRSGGEQARRFGSPTEQISPVVRNRDNLDPDEGPRSHSFSIRTSDVLSSEENNTTPARVSTRRERREDDAAVQRVRNEG